MEGGLLVSLATTLGQGMNIGKLAYRITIQQPVTSRDAYGQEVVGSWQDVPGLVNIPAGKAFDTTRKADEEFTAEQKQATQQITWRIRYRAGILPTWRVMENGVAFPLIGLPVEVERRHVLDLKTEYRG